MEEKIVVTTILEEDLEQLQQLYAELIPEGCQLSTIQKLFQKVKERKEYHILAAKRGAEVLGSVMGIECIALDAPFLVVENVVVKKSCHRQGIGRKLFEALDVIAKENNCEYTILVSSGYRKNAHKFYESVGFTEDVRGFRKYYEKK